MATSDSFSPYDTLLTGPLRERRIIPVAETDDTKTR